MPRFFKTVKQGLQHSDSDSAYRDLGEQQLGLLYALAKEKQLTSELARTFNITMPTITRSVDTFVEKGYVERQPDATDRRCIYPQLTDKGMTVHDRAQAEFRSAICAFFIPAQRRATSGRGEGFRAHGTIVPEGTVRLESVCPVKPATLEAKGKQAAQASGEIGTTKPRGTN